jgi:hypothetical protein
MTILLRPFEAIRDWLLAVQNVQRVRCICAAELAAERAFGVHGGTSGPMLARRIMSAIGAKEAP